MNFICKKYISLLFFAFLTIFSFGLLSQKLNAQDTIRSPYEYSFKELSRISITTGALKNENSLTIPANVTIITKKMIIERGYQTLVDVCQDIAGFDFLVFNDGGGEYPTYNKHRGLGSVGNSKILILLDGVIQNNISFNWSLLWTYENSLTDIERIEIIQGPGSVLYGAQAFSGIIHIITKSNFSGIKVKTFYGSNNTSGTDIFAGKCFKNGIKTSLTFHKYHSDGDGGLRYDPGNYFRNIKYPELILQDYDNKGNYLTNTRNPLGGKNITDGFNTVNNSYSFRAKASYKKTELNIFYQESDKGSASYLTAFEYNVTDKSFRNISNSYHIVLRNETDIVPKLSLKSSLTFRSTNILPKTGFKYLYRFPDLIKNYVSYAYRTYIKENFYYNLNSNNILLIGFRGAYSIKNRRIISLGDFPESKTLTPSSWEAAEAGNGLGIKKTYSPGNVYEAATYVLWDNKWSNYLSSSIGLRYDLSTEFGNVMNPRLALIYTGRNGFGFKLLYGTAFRQPSIFELTSEFRGNPDLKPEKIKTYEFETNCLTLNKKLALKSNIFYSNITNFIDKVKDESMPAGERFENTGNSKISGISLYGNLNINKQIKINTNYNFILGKNTDTAQWQGISHTAKHKINAGINIHFLKNKAMIDLRMNYAGKRKAPETNLWLQTYENGFAPSYTKLNLNISYYFHKQFTIQLNIRNLLNEQFYGVGRETGSSFIDDYNYRTNPNPEGFIPAYHPQPGRTYTLNLFFDI